MPAERSTRQALVRRVQRPTDEFPVVHLEADIPTPKHWVVSIDGLVGAPLSWSLASIRAMQCEEVEWDLHCVWGWTRPRVRWGGIRAARLIDECRPLDSATHVLARQIEGPYASCLTIDEARRSLLAWRCDGMDLTPERGAPLRLVTPENKWGYKHVKWVGRLVLISGFSPGFWEEMVGNPRGDIPPEKLDLRFEE